MRLWIIYLVFQLFVFELHAQVDSTFQLSLNSTFLFSNSTAVPFWLVSNRFGIFEGDKNEFLLQADIDKKIILGEKFQINTGGNFIFKNQFDQSYIHEVYANIEYGKLKLIAGKEELTYTQYSENTSTGSYYFSNNARPIPRIGIGFYEYTDLPFTNGFLQIKGFLNQGILMDDRGEFGTKKPLFHEKIAYVRTNKLPVNVHVGLNHSALFGGTLPDGTEIPIDYWATFFGKGSPVIGGGEATNAAGAHLGLFDAGFNAKIRNSDIQFYFQKPFRDKSGFTRFFENNRDHLFGFILKLNEKNSIIKEIIYENVNLLWQSGEGIPDLIINGNVYLPPDLKDKDKIMWEEYGIVTEGISNEDFWRFVTRKENYGFKYGGRDNYYNNGLYQMGWSNLGKALGNPLVLSEKRVKSINPEFESVYDFYFVNTRVLAHHIGLLAEVKKFKIRSLLTYTKNFGTHTGLNRGISNWDSKDAYSDYRYYFEYGLYEVYALFDFEYTLKTNPNFTLNFEFGADFGEMYNSAGFMVGLKYQPIFKKSKPSN